MSRCTALRRCRLGTACVLMIVLGGTCVSLGLQRMWPRHWEASAIAFAPDGRKLIVGVYTWYSYHETSRYLVGGVAQSVKSLNSATGQLIEEIERTRSSQVRHGLSPEPRAWVAFSPDGGQLAIGHWEGGVLLRDATTWRPLRAIDEVPSVVNNVTFLRDGRTLCVGFREFPRLWNLQRPDEARHVQADARALATALSPDGTRLAFATGSADLKLIDAESLQEVRRFCWSAATGKLAARDDFDLYRCRRAAFTPDGLHIVVSLHGDRDRSEVKIVDLETGAEVHRFANRSGVIRFSPDGRRMAIGGQQGLSLIVADTRQEVVFEPYEGILDLAFSPDSQTIVLGDGDGWVECRDAGGLLPVF